MNQLQSGFVHANNAHLYYECAGTGHPLVLLHGHLLDSRQWDDQFTAFAPFYHVLRFDARGFGRSTHPPESFSYHDDLAVVLSYLDITRAAFIGCSGGGATIIDFALTYPEMVSALVLVGTGLSGYHPPGPVPPQVIRMEEARRSGDIAQAVELSLQFFTDGPRRTPQHVNPVARDRTRVMSTHLFARPAVPDAAAQLLEPPAISRLADIHAPTLVINGAEDQAPLHEIAGLVTTHIAGAQHVVIPDAGHHPNLEHPTAFNQVVRAFLDNVVDAP